MWSSRSSANKRLKRAASLLAWLVLALLSSAASAQENPPPKRILALYWYGKDFPSSVVFDQGLQTAFRSSSTGTVEYYPEYLESNRFPGERQSQLLRDYLRQKYADRKIDVVIAFANPSLNFLLKYRNDLFPGVPIVFQTIKRPESLDQASAPGLTGVVYDQSYRNTLDLALRLHPATEQVFVITGTPERDKALETEVRQELKEFENRVTLTYLTDLPMDELTTRVKNAPARSVILYIRHSVDGPGMTLGPRDVLTLIVQSAHVPVYGIADSFVGSGIVGGSVFNTEASASRVAEVALRVANGERPQDIPIAVIPTLPVFDSRQLQVWGITDDRLPPGSIVRFKEPTLWEQYKWRIVGVISLCILEALLIVWLLVNRARRKEAQRESERLGELAAAEHRRLDEVVSNVPGMVWEVSIEPDSGRQKTQYVSRFVEQMLGYRAEDFLGTVGFGLSLVPEEDRERVQRETNEIFAGGTSGTIQFRWLTRDGRLIWVEAQLAVMRDEQGRPVGLRGVTMDITDRKLAEESLRHSEERNQAILRAIPDLMFLQSREGTYLDYHATDPQRLLIPPAEFLGKNMREVLPPELADSLAGCFERSEQTEKPQLLEYSLPIRNEERWFEARVVRSNGDKVLSVVRDVTDRKLAEARLKDSESQLAGIISSAMDAIISIDEHQQVVLFNAAAEKMFGCSAGEAIGQCLDQFIPERFLPADHVDVFRKTNLTMQAMGSLMPLFGRRATGEDFPIEASISQIELKGQNFFTVIMRDVSRRSRAEKALRESEERFAKAFRANPQPMSLTTLAEGRYVDVNDSFLKMSGYQREEVIGRTSIELGIWKTPETRAEFMQELTEHGIRNVETHFGIKGGSFRVLLSSAELVKIGNEQCVLVASSDITDRKQAEELLRESEERLKQAISVARFGAFEHDHLTGILHSSALTREIHAWGEEDTFSLEKLVAQLYPEDREAFIATISSAHDPAGDGFFAREYRIVLDGGKVRWVSARAQTFFEGEGGARHPVRTIGAELDITERKEAEEALRVSESRFRTMADSAPLMIWMCGPDKLCTYLNQGWLDFTGRRMEQELGNGWYEGVYTDDVDRCLETYNLAFDRKEPFRMEYRLRRADGQFRWVYDSGTPRFSSDGEFLGYIGSCIDIADRKEGEDAVRAAKDELRLIADALPVLISEVDKNGCYRFNNLAYQNWFGQPPEKITGRHMREVLGEAVWERIRPQVERSLAGHEVHYEDFLSYRDGGPRWVSVTGIPTRDAAGAVNGFVSLVADITESRRAEEALRDLSGRLINAQEEERSRVARELHDDLSQRMAVLSIGLEQIGQQIPEGPGNFQGRIQDLRSKAQEVSTEIHRLSYQLHPSKLDHLGLASAVKSFCEELAARHEITIKFRQNGFPATIPKDITLCVFRITQESLHNVARHSGARGAEVVLEKTDQEVRLSVSDLGCGFDTDSNRMTSGLGFIGMRERLRLVGGQLSIRSRPSQGTQIEVSVPLVERAKRASAGSSGQTTGWSGDRNAVDESSQASGVE